MSQRSNFQFPKHTAQVPYFIESSYINDWFGWLHLMDNCQSPYMILGSILCNITTLFHRLISIKDRYALCFCRDERAKAMFPCWKSQLHSPTVIRFHASGRPNLRNYWKIQIIIAYYLGTLSVQTLIYWYRPRERAMPRNQKQNPEPETEPRPKLEVEP